MFQKTSHKYHTRQSGQYRKPLKKTKVAQFSICYRGPHLWNAFLKHFPNIDRVESVSSFSYKTKAILKAYEENGNRFF